MAGQHMKNLRMPRAATRIVRVPGGVCAKGKAAAPDPSREARIKSYASNVQAGRPLFSSGEGP
jgi:hypothetical protein